MQKLSLNAYTLKWIAIIGMIANHVAIAWSAILPLGVMLPMYAVGGLTYTIMAFFVVDGYRYTSNLKKYIGRLLLIGLIAQAFHPMVLGVTQIMPGIFLNIMFTITLSLIVLLLYDKIKIRALFWILVFPIAIILSLHMDLFFMGPIIPLLYYTIKKESRRRTLPGVVSGTIWLIVGLLSALSILALLHTPGGEQQVYYLLNEMGMTMPMVWATPTFALGCFAAAILLRNYNGERGKPAKWLFYIIYPAHLAVIAVISVALGLTEFSLFGF